MKSAPQTFHYDHPWELMVVAYMRRWPTHQRISLLLASEVVSDEVTPFAADTPLPFFGDFPEAQWLRAGVRKIVRRCVIRMDAPSWIKMALQASDLTFLQTTVVDAAQRSMVITNKNVSFTDMKIVLGDSCEYRAYKDKPLCTYFEQVADFELPPFLPFVSTCEKLTASYNSNTAAGRLIDIEFVHDVINDGWGSPSTAAHGAADINQLHANGSVISTESNDGYVHVTSQQQQNGGRDLQQAGGEEAEDSRPASLSRDAVLSRPLSAGRGQHASRNGLSILLQGGPAAPQTLPRSMRHSRSEDINGASRQPLPATNGAPISGAAMSHRNQHQNQNQNQQGRILSKASYFYRRPSMDAPGNIPVESLRRTRTMQEETTDGVIRDHGQHASIHLVHAATLLILSVFLFVFSVLAPIGLVALISVNLDDSAFSTSPLSWRAVLQGSISFIFSVTSVVLFAQVYRFLGLEHSSVQQSFK